MDTRELLIARSELRHRIDDHRSEISRLRETEKPGPWLSALEWALDAAESPSGTLVGGLLKAGAARMVRNTVERSVSRFNPFRWFRKLI